MLTPVCPSKFKAAAAASIVKLPAAVCHVAAAAELIDNAPELVVKFEAASESNEIPVASREYEP